MINCEGCETYDVCQLKWHDDERGCPCGKCLVKVMCYQSCEEFDKFSVARRLKMQGKENKKIRHLALRNKDDKKLLRRLL